MTIEDSHAIFHIGAPKCGSSALQAAWSAEPDRPSRTGLRVRYIGAVRVGGKLMPLRGGAVRRAAALSPYGYVSMPDPGREVVGKALGDFVLREIARARRRGYIPFISNEGWIRRPDFFTRLLSDLGHPPVTVLAFLRPPLTWMNAAFWQWGVWSRPRFDDWLSSRRVPFSFGGDLAAWARIPNVGLQVAPAKQDVVTFADALLGTPGNAIGPCNSTGSAAQFGFLLRNRRFRPDSHRAEIEFVLQRQMANGPTLRRAWAIAPRHVETLQRLAQSHRRELERVLPAVQAEQIFDDPLWTAPYPYHPEIERGPAPLDDLDELCAFAGGLLSKPLSEGAQLGALDESIAERLGNLLRADRSLRWRTALLGAPRDQTPRPRSFTLREDPGSSS
ncbi:hypothetical protein [Thioclava sp. F28-4]|uniref:hypothetical protein n=1 Tax=Thioclava sp. F28-4 TaxID=1915315 RepID=UPI0011BAD126|nr:hypothetical protein [Thioclava sp. F28-4]